MLCSLFFFYLTILPRRLWISVRFFPWGLERQTEKNFGLFPAFVFLAK
jgi:hypothetical protein